MVIVVAAALTSMVAVVCAAWAEDEAVEPARQVRAWLLEDDFAGKR